MPYSAFKLYKKGEGTQSDTLLMNRNEGFRIEIENTSGKAWEGECQIDNLEQLTSYELKGGTPKFSSIFIQLNKDAYENEDWDQQFRDSKEVGIDTWIIQYSQQFTGNHDETNVSFYKNTNLPWVQVKCDIIDKMFEAAERNGMKIILGCIRVIIARPTLLILLNTTSMQNGIRCCLMRFMNNLETILVWQVGTSPKNSMMVLIRQDGNKNRHFLCWLSIWKVLLLIIKTKSNKPVSIAPALWRGLPADLCGQWFGRIFKQTPNIDHLYLQDIGGRCLVDFDVDLP